MRRRNFVTLVGASVMSLPLAARAQQAAMPTIGFLGGGSREPTAVFVDVFRQRLRQAGYIDGQNLTILQRWAEGHTDHLPLFAAELVQRKVSLIAAVPFVAALAAKAATATIPIVFISGADPVSTGLVASLSHPGGNLTGVTNLSVGLIAKQLQILHEMIPSAGTLGLLLNPDTQVAFASTPQDARAASASLGVEVQTLEATNPAEIDAAVSEAVARKIGAMVVSPDPYFVARRDQIVTLAARNALPTIYSFSEIAAGGGLISYGTRLSDGYDLLGVYAARVLGGEKPADLPVQQSVKVELVINLKTAATLGLKIPLPLLGRADEVIE